MAKYKPGDKVIVRTDLDEDERYWMDDKCDYWYPEEEMVKLAGKTVTIKKAKYAYYLVEETSGVCYWTDEMFVDNKEEVPVPKTPREFKVGDRVKVTEIGYNQWENLREKGVDIGTVIVYNNKDSIGIEFDKNFGGHDCGAKDCKNGHGWWLTDRGIELVKEEPKEEPTPTPVVNVNVTVNLYENACWYCRKGGLVDLYLAGAMGICPSCGRVCNNTLPTKPKK